MTLSSIAVKQEGRERPRKGSGLTQGSCVEQLVEKSGLMLRKHACVCPATQSCLTLCDPRANQALLSMGFPRQDYGSGLPFPPPGDLPNPGIEPKSPVT